ncbi:MAG: MFS transporter [Paludisphaera borealis]|uniref:MFS transporter n=1 Tax=Paludisphaera borealis TaxID=1387353 RepID=UPI0028506332|nr:MFS transporter [Paludisphaera borealis]MDR3619558.1 MFS transporter [Paludisphaera borealis]
MSSPSSPSALDRAVSKAYWRLLPLLFIGYVIAYIDRVNVSFAKLQMQKDLHSLGFTESVLGFGMGIFFIGYLILEIPGTLLVERWSARKWISRILVSWGIVAAMTAFVHYRIPGVTGPLESMLRGLSGLIESFGGDASSLKQDGSVYVFQFWAIRFLLGVAEAGFYPGVIVYLTHWFPHRDRSRALAWFFVGSPIATILGPPVSAWLINIGVKDNPPILGLVGWQWIFIFWGIPAVVLGLIVLVRLTDWPHQALWLSTEEREALQSELDRERAEAGEKGHMTVMQALRNPKVLILAAAYFFVVTGNYGVEFYMPSILKDWYDFDVKQIAWLVIIPPIGSLIGQLVVGWSSDRMNERRWHASLPIVLGAAALACTAIRGNPAWLTVALFLVAMTGLKAYLPAFWTLPSMLMTQSAAAASIGLINSFGNLGGMVGPTMLGVLKENTNSYQLGIWILSTSMVVSASIIFRLGIGRQAARAAKPAVAVEV